MRGRQLRGRARHSGTAAAPSATPSRSIELTTRSPSARPRTTSVNSQFAMPVSIVRAASVPRRGVEHVDGLVGQHDGRRHAQHVVALVEHDLDVRAVAREQAGFLGVVEFRLDLDRARLFLLIEHVRRHAPHVTRERPVGKRVEADARRQPGLDPRRVDLVDRRADVQAGRVDEVDGRRRRDADGRGRDELAELAVDFRDDAAERSAQLAALELRFRDVDARFGDARRVLGRRAARPRSTPLCPAPDPWLPPTRAVWSWSLMRRSASRFATAAITQASRARERDARASRSDSSSSALMSSFHSSSSSAPCSTRSPSLTGRLAILPAERGRQPRSPARVDGARARVRDRGGDGAAIDGRRG